MMLNSLWRYIMMVVLVVGATALAEAKQVPDRPSPPQLVNDMAGILGLQQQRSLERKLRLYNDSTSTQIAVVIERTIGGDDIFDYTYRLAEKWGIGQKDKDNGVLIFVAAEDRQLRILTGYGVEGFLPDAAAKQIVEDVIVPEFKQGKYYEGLNKATTVIIKLSKGEYTADDLNRGRRSEGGIPPIVIFMLIIVIFIILSNMQSGGGSGHDEDDDGGYYRGGRYERMPRSGRRGGGWIVVGPGGGGGWSPGGGGSIGGGGGFGGFGGGSFGGGGAGGSW